LWLIPCDKMLVIEVSFPMNLMRLGLLIALPLVLPRPEGLPEPHARHVSQQNSDAPAAKQESASATGSPAESGQPLTAPLDISVPAEPWAFRANGQWNLVYELHVANIGNEACTLKQVSVSGLGDTSKRLTGLTGRDLNAAIAHPWVDEKAPATIAPASFAVVFMWISLGKDEVVPAALLHTMTVSVGSYPEDLSLTMPAVQVNRKPVPVIGSPLRGADWGAAHGPSNDSQHRRGLLPIDGRSYLAERYAIDWIRIAPSGEPFTGSGKTNQDFPGYGADVLAVADGTITEVTDDIPENVPGRAPAVPITLRTICGNHLIEKIGDGLYASYCHLQPGLKLTPGIRVKRGQVLGALGNTGSSDGPHLHFHLCSMNSNLACEGIPYALASFGEEHKDFGSPSGTKPQPVTLRVMELPTNEMLVSFH
jgi:murein DD-endopeptidase